MHKQRKKAKSRKRLPKLFLSYARGDDEQFVRRLYDDLTKAGFKIWFDRVDMPSRQLTFYQEIRQAIEKRKRLLLVIGPKAACSEYVNQEWRWALERGKCVNPIVRSDERSDDDKEIDGYELVLMTSPPPRNSSTTAVTTYAMKNSLTPNKLSSASKSYFHKQQIKPILKYIRAKGV